MLSLLEKQSNTLVTKYIKRSMVSRAHCGGWDIKRRALISSLEEQAKVLEKVTPKLIHGDISRKVREEGLFKPRNRRHPALLAVRTPLPRSVLLFSVVIIA